MELLGTSLIGNTRASAGPEFAEAIHAATGAPLGPRYSHARAEDVARATGLAAQAFGSFGKSSGKSRGSLLRRVAELIQEHTAELVERAGLETGLPAARLQGEIGRTTGQLRLFAQVAEDGHWVDARIDRADPARSPLPKPDLRSMLRPLGPVVVFSSSNFPFAFSVAGGDTASALAAGCPVIVKAHQGHLGTSELTGLLVARAVRDLDLPEGTFSLIFGPGRQTGIALVTDPQVKAVGFTGSTTGGRALMDAAAARPDPIPVYAEMGSVNPVFLLPGALAERREAIAKGLHASVTLGVGQFCTNPGLVFAVDSPDLDVFLAELSGLMAATPAGVMLTPAICREYAQGVADSAGIPGVSCLASAPAPDKAPTATGCACLLAADLATFLARPDLQREMFGPATLVVRCPSAEELAAVAATLPGQLTATIHAAAGELEGYTALLDAITGIAGRIVVNAYPTGVEVCHAMHHGGPYPATSDGRTTSVGSRAIFRFARPVCYQDMPDACLPDELKEANPLGLKRME